MRNLKILGLAFVAMLALGAVGATAASADELTSEKNLTTLTGFFDVSSPEKADQFITTAGTVSCTNPKYSGTIVGSVTIVNVTPDYSAGTCTTAGVPSKIEMNGCSYTFTILGGESTTGGAALDCPVGKEATITVTPASGTHPCTVHVAAQAVDGQVHYKNIGAGTTGEVTVEATLSGIDYTHTAGTGLAKCTAGSAGNGTLTAKATVTGEEDLTQKEKEEGKIPKHVGLLLSKV